MLHIWRPTEAGAASSREQLACPWNPSISGKAVSAAAKWGDLGHDGSDCVTRRHTSSLRDRRGVLHWAPYEAALCAAPDRPSQRMIPGSGIWSDIRSRAPWYKQDWKDGFAYGLRHARLNQMLLVLQCCTVLRSHCQSLQTPWSLYICFLPVSSPCAGFWGADATRDW